MNEIRELIRSGKSARFQIERLEVAWREAYGTTPEYLSYHAPYVAYQWALGKNLITKEEYEMAREYHGRGWNYVGD